MGARVPLHYEVKGLHLGVTVVCVLQGSILSHPLPHPVAVCLVGVVTEVVSAPPAGDDRDAPQCTTDVPVAQIQNFDEKPGAGT